MKMYLIVFLALALLTTHIQVNAGGNTTNNYYVTEVTETSEATETNPIQITRSDGNYALLGMAAAGNVLDWGVPDKLQLSVAGAFVPGGSQAISFAAGSRVGGILVNVHIVTTIDTPNSKDDYAFIVGATGHF